MKALILVGGFGTRLRPLTFSAPKPLVPFCNVPILVHQIEALVRVGVKKVILAVNYQPQQMMDFLKVAEAKYGISIVISQEKEPLGTAGPVALARALLEADDSPFFMLNSDVICEFPLQAMVDFHLQRKGEGTILVTQVKDPSKYGVVVTDHQGKIGAFVEKPPGPNFPSHMINAGIYLFNVDVVKRIPLRPTSIEREIFPQIASEEKLYAMDLSGYWMDVGQPKDYVAGTALHLHSLSKLSAATLATGAHVRGNVLIDSSAKIGRDALLGPDVVIGPNVVIEDGARIKASTIFEGSRIQKHAFIQRSIIGWACNVGAWSRVSDSVFGEDVQVAAEVSVQEATVCPHKEIKEDSLTPKIFL